MSLQAMVKAIKAKDLTPTEKLVLICLANYANESDQAWPRQSTIATECGLTRQTVIKTYQALEAKGIIRCVERASDNGANISKIVEMFPPVSEAYTPVSETDTPCKPALHPPVSEAYTHIDKPINYNQLNEPSDLTRSITIIHHGEIVTPFDDFWKAYPNKTGKKLAKAFFDKLTRTVPPNEILEGLERAKARDPRFRTLQFTPHPKSWLNSEGWNDEHPEHTTSNLLGGAGQGRPIDPYVKAALAVDERRRTGTGR